MDKGSSLNISHMAITVKTRGVEKPQDLGLCNAQSLVLLKHLFTPKSLHYFGMHTSMDMSRHTFLYNIYNFKILVI
jgi:hypothetical protein